MRIIPRTQLHLANQNLARRIVTCCQATSHAARVSSATWRAYIAPSCRVDTCACVKYAFSRSISVRCVAVASSRRSCCEASRTSQQPHITIRLRQMTTMSTSQTSHCGFVLTRGSTECSELIKLYINQSTDLFAFL